MTKSAKSTDKARENGIGVWLFADTDWVAAKCLEDALNWYQELSGCSAQEIQDGGVQQITDLDATKMHPDEERKAPLISLRKAVRALRRVPDIVASTEF